MRLNLPYSNKRKLQLLVLLSIPLAIASLVSHGLVAWLGIETTTGRIWRVGPATSKPPFFMAGSSLAGDGISWDRACSALGRKIEVWGVAGSSPWEWEPFQHRASDTEGSFLVISVYDLNEHFLCDFHSDVVSPIDTFKDLWRSGADWQFFKRVISRYPLKYLRALFPTAGRSQGVMSGLRDELQKVLGSKAAIAGEAGPTLAMGKGSEVPEYKKVNVSAWPKDRVLRRLALMRGACQGKHTFNGPKHLAFLRMLEYAESHGGVTVVVLPVSPVYATEFLSADVARQFEEMITEARHIVPQAHWVRLDRLPELKSNDCFWDFVHMNATGQRIATDALLKDCLSVSLGRSEAPSTSP
jgi:hypothetical protein